MGKRRKVGSKSPSIQSLMQQLCAVATEVGPNYTRCFTEYVEREDRSNPAFFRDPGKIYLVVELDPEVCGEEDPRVLLAMLFHSFKKIVAVLWHMC